MKKPLTFTIDAGPGTLWKVEVIIHPNHKALMRARRAKTKFYSTGTHAFCYSLGSSDALDQSKIAVLHFDRTNLKIGLIVHEATHAAIAWAGMCRLDFNTEKGEEAFAESVQHLTEGIRWGIRKYCRKNL